MGARQSGIVGALTILSKSNKIISAVSYSDDLTNILNNLKVPLYKTIKEKGFIEKLKKSDLLLSVHGREIANTDLLRLPKFGAVNIHPYLYRYKGTNPVERALKDRNFHASVGAHIMGEVVDKGKVLVEEFVDLDIANSVDEIYNRLYPYYCIVILKVLKIISKKYEKYKK